MSTIELDCPPGFPRPNDLIEGVLAESGLTLDDFSTGAPFFGHQVWELKAGDERAEKFQTAKPLFKARIVGLYNTGEIRAGSW